MSYTEKLLRPGELLALLMSQIKSRAPTGIPDILINQR